MEALNVVFVVLVMTVIAFFGLDAFFGLVGDLYTLLDSYIWAFFAGIIAFFTSIFIVSLMIQITLIAVAGLLGFLSLFFR